VHIRVAALRPLAPTTGLTTANTTTEFGANLIDSAEPRYRCSKIKIPRGNSRVEVRHGDLYPEKDRAKFIDKPNYKSNVASVGLPFAVRMKRLLFDQYKDLYIVSPDSSPESSPENSAHTTPSSTWEHGRQEVTGAQKPPAPRQ
jgi:hypothetical protein